MIRSSIILSVIMLFIMESKGQPAAPDTLVLINSGEVIKEGIALHDQKKYDLAIAKYLTVPESDTNYVWMCSELVGSYTQNKEYEKAIELARQLLNNRSAYQSLLYCALGNAYDDNGQSDKAIETYQAGLQAYPYDYLLHYNLGIAWNKQKESDKAVKQFTQAITVNPFHANSHLYLAEVMIKQGRKSRAMMCLGTYLALVPNNNAVLVLFNDLLKNSLTFQNTQPLAETTNAFYQTDLLINSNAALDGKFKSSVAFKAPVVQQTELLLESLQPDQTDDFWMEFYVPFYHKIHQNNAQQAFLYHLLTSVDHKSVKKWLSSHKKDSEKFYDLANKYLKTYRSQHTATVDGKTGTYSFWYYNNNKLNAIGNQVDEKTYAGPWIFYYPNGEVKAARTYTDKGYKTGNWHYHYADGTPEKTETYDANGKVTGTTVHFHENSKVAYEIPYKADKAEGIVKIYFPCGQLKEELAYKNDQRHGPGTVYYNTGQISHQYAHHEGALTGAYTSYYTSGKIS